MSFSSVSTELPPALEQVLFPGRRMASALERHASGLRMSFYGLIVIVGGVLCLLPLLGGRKGPVPPPVAKQLMQMGIVAVIAGGLANLWGKYRCYEFPLKLSGRWLLTYAVWCDGFLFAIRFLSRSVPALKTLRVAEPLLVLTGLILFLLFIRSLADVIHRLDLRQAARNVLRALYFTVLTGIAAIVLSVFIRKNGPASALLVVALLLASLAGLITWLVLYGRLLWRMSTALRDFARFLREDEAEEIDPDLANVSQEPA